MKNVLLKDTGKEIKNTFKRFLSILLVVLLGVGFFAGIKATSPDMKITLDKYFDEKNVMDIQVISTLGLTDEDIKSIEDVDGVENVEGTYSQDVIVSIDEEEAVIKLETIAPNLNQLVLVDGRMPEKADECVIEESMLTWTKHQIGDTITVNAKNITDDDGNEKELLQSNTMKIVGTVQSPMYISRERGSTKLGSGKINYYMYVMPEAVSADIYTAAYVTVQGAKELDSTSEKYDDTVQRVKDKIEEISDKRKQERYDEVYNQANSKIQDAQKTLNEEKTKAEKELNDAQKKIDDAKKEIEEGKAEIEANRKKADTQFANAENKLKEAETELSKQKDEFETKKKEAEKHIEENKEALANLQTLQKQYSTAKTNLSTKQKELTELNNKLNELNPNTDGEEIANITTQIAKTTQEIYILNATISEIEKSLTAQGIKVDNLMSVITSLESGIKKAESEIEAGEEQITDAEKELKNQKSTLASQKAKTYSELDSAEKKLNDGEKEIAENEKKFEEARKEADEKIADAEEELEEAKLKLDDIKKPEWYILDRNQNAGHASYSQDADRIAKIATVFPVVFFVVAALISLTSMSRMVEEERVQIGTLKALRIYEGKYCKQIYYICIVSNNIWFYYRFNNWIQNTSNHHNKNVWYDVYTFRNGIRI